MLNIDYGMGQYRYEHGHNYLSPLSFNKEARHVKISNDSSTTDVYEDIFLRPVVETFSFVEGTPYLLHLEIPKNSNYDTSFRIKMIPNIADNVDVIADSHYQIIKYIDIPKMNGQGNISKIILYPVEDDGHTPWQHINDGNKTVLTEYIDLNNQSEITEEIAETLQEEDVILFEDRFWLWHVDAEKEEIKNKVDSILEHVWMADSSQNDRVTFDIVFSPKSSDETYNAIWIQMIRESYDQDIQDQEGVYGRKVDINNFDFELNLMNNLISTSSGPITHTPLNHIGVYSHPNLIMAINGEEIRVGQSGYYELNDFDIKSLAIAANSDEDRFTIDYQYKITTE